MSAPAAYKPSPLGYGSPPTRSSPFRRPGSPASPSPLRHTTPTGSPTKASTAIATASRFANPSTPTKPPISSETIRPSDRIIDFADTSSSSSLRQPIVQRPQLANSLSNGNALSKLQPAQVRTLRDGFQILDRDCDGVVTRDDVADMLTQLGLPATPAHVATFFPPSAPQTIPLAGFLNSLAETLSVLSPSSELLSAFSAFDDDDSGQVDLAELKDALINTAPEPGEKPLTSAEVDKVLAGFTGRRAFNRNMNAQLGAKRGDVFKYQEFVNSVMGTGSSLENAAQDVAEG